jgi:hypothetical protein
MTLYQMDPSTRTYIKMDMADLENSMAPMAQGNGAGCTKVTETDETSRHQWFQVPKIHADHHGRWRATSG